MSRVFLMKWYHFSVEYFEDLRNVNHCEFLIMKKQESGKYLLENKLRTWSELRRERALQAVKEGKGEKSEKGTEAAVKPNGTSKDSSKLDKAPSSIASSNRPSSPAIIETHRRWGGCPNGCDHDKNFKIRQNLADLVKSDSSTSEIAAAHDSSCPQDGTTANADDSSSLTNARSDPSFCGSGETKALADRRRPVGKRFIAQNADAEVSEEAGLHIDVSKALEDGVSSPSATSSSNTVEDRLRGAVKDPASQGNRRAADDCDEPRHHNHHHHHHHHHLLHVGRDGGGTYSGHNSVVASDADSSEDERHRRRRQQLAGVPLRPKLSTVPSASGSNSRVDSSESEQTHHKKRRDSRMGRGTRANRLGDVPHSSDGEHEADAEGEPDDLEDELEEVERSVQGSVF
jgi:hypothetical protein